jgi:hypothetical protein
MHSLSLALQYGEREGSPLHCPYPGIRQMRAFFRKGQLSMVAGPPGGGKTALCTDYLLNQKETVLYFSADGDRGTVGNRVIACLKGWPLHEVERIMKNPPVALFRQLDELTGHIAFCFRSSLSPDFITQEVQRYAITNGEYPAVIVVDNLIDMTAEAGGGMDDHSGHAASAKWLKDLASETGAAVIVLHHTVGVIGGSDPIPRTAILGKIDRHPRLILTISRPSDTQMFVSVVKNSNGPADQTGFLGTTIDVDLESMTFSKD